jgi:hypothetical protein
VTDLEQKNLADDVRQAKPMTTEEAMEAVLRFINSHFLNTHRERARITIPADPQRDDDIRLMAHIKRTGDEVARLRAAIKAAFFEGYDACEDDKYSAWEASGTLKAAREAKPC